MRVTEYILHLLKKKATQGNCLHKISALGFNHKGELVARGSNKKRFQRPQGGNHAEEEIFRVAKRKGIKTVLICRISRTGNLLPIDPCEKCASIAKKLGIKIISIKK